MQRADSLQQALHLQQPGSEDDGSTSSRASAGRQFHAVVKQQPGPITSPAPRTTPYMPLQGHPQLSRNAPMTLPVIPTAYIITSARTDAVELFTGLDTPNKYVIYNDQGQFMYYAQEQQNFAGFLAAQHLGDNRGFFFTATDGLGRLAFSVGRTSKLWTDCEMFVEAPPGIPAGFVSYNSTLCSRGVLTIWDMDRNTVLSVPFPPECDCGGDRGYSVMTGSDIVGSIVRKYPGFMKQAFTNCDNFALDFPVDLDVRIKCTLLACAIMIDFIDYEDKRNGGKNNNQGGGD